MSPFVHQVPFNPDFQQSFFKKCVCIYIFKNMTQQLGSRYSGYCCAQQVPVQMASKKGGRRALPCSWTTARMGGSPVEPVLVQEMTCAWCVGEGGACAHYKSRPKAAPPAKRGPNGACGPWGVVHRGATACIPDAATLSFRVRPKSCYNFAACRC